jgi:hypothetical protein
MGLGGAYLWITALPPRTKCGTMKVTNNIMIQDQLVDYISSQMKLGVSRDAIKAALVSAGWVAGDIEDTLKKVDGSASTSSAVKPTSSPASSLSSFSATVNPAATNKGSSPQVIRVSDLVSSSPSSMSSPSTSTASLTSAMSGKPAKSMSFGGGKINGNTFEASPANGAMAGAVKGGSSKMTMMIGWVVAAVLVLGCAGLAWHFYSANAALSQQVASLTSQSATVNSQLDSLKSEVDASTSALTAQVASLMTANADLALNLSFYAVSTGGSASGTVAVLPVNISGWLTTSTRGYIITTARGAKILVANATDLKIAPSLKASAGAMVYAQGTYLPGSDQITVASISTSSVK